MDENNAKEKIELRAEPERRKIGGIPASVTRWSIIAIAIVAVALACALAFVPYPYSSGESIFRHIFAR